MDPIDKNLTGLAGMKITERDMYPGSPEKRAFNQVITGEELFH